MPKLKEITVSKSVKLQFEQYNPIETGMAMTFTVDEHEATDIPKAERECREILNSCIDEAVNETIDNGLKWKKGKRL